MKRLQWFLPALILAVFLLVACSGAAAPASTPPAQSAPDVANIPAAAIVASGALAQSLNVPAEEVTVLSYEAVDWPDSCLGAAAADEMCAMVITPGYKVVVEHEGEQQTLHTNEDGSVWRVAP